MTPRTPVLSHLGLTTEELDTTRPVTNIWLSILILISTHTVKPFLTGPPLHRDPLYTKHVLWSQIY